MYTGLNRPHEPDSACSEGISRHPLPSTESRDHQGLVALSKTSPLDTLFITHLIRPGKSSLLLCIQQTLWTLPDPMDHKYQVNEQVTEHLTACAGVQGLQVRRPPQPQQAAPRPMPQALARRPAMPYQGVPGPQQQVGVGSQPGVAQQPRPAQPRPFYNASQVSRQSYNLTLTSSMAGFVPFHPFLQHDSCLGTD